MSTITSANSIFTLTVYNTSGASFLPPSQIQGFASDDAFLIDTIETTETLLGVDGIMSAGWLPTIKTQSVSLQADSISNDYFEAWFAGQEAARDVFWCAGQILYPSVSKSYTLINGVLFGYTPLSAARKVLQPRRFSIRWNTIIALAV